MPKCITESKYDCCGCSACYSVCPVKAIEMVEDEEGFLYPQIDENKCIGCKLCQEVCPLNNKPTDNNPHHLFAVKNKNENERINSTSGGVFSLLAHYVELQKGVIYGAAFSDKYKVKHMRAETQAEWKKFCVSKYVQSDINDVFSMVEYDLHSDKLVLFTGTPCQVDGLKQYLQKKKNNVDKLITCDIVCHGVPSPKIWHKYLQFISKNRIDSIGNISFRDKTEKGWHNSTLTIDNTENNNIICETHGDNLYSQLFFAHYILRLSCHTCKYANLHRPGDITLGDFWGIEKHYSEFDDEKGISLVMINSPNGKNIWEKINKDVEFIEVTKEQAIQPNLTAPSAENPNRDFFWRWYKKYGFKVAGQRIGYIPKNIMDSVKIFVYRCFDKMMRIMKRM